MNGDYPRKVAIVVCIAGLCGTIGLVVPQLIDHRIGGTFAPALIGMVGVLIGAAAGVAIVVRALH